MINYPDGKTIDFFFLYDLCVRSSFCPPTVWCNILTDYRAFGSRYQRKIYCDMFVSQPNKNSNHHQQTLESILAFQNYSIKPIYLGQCKSKFSFCVLHCGWSLKEKLSFKKISSGNCQEITDLPYIFERFAATFVVIFVILF
jgi:hypothetical protein